MKGKALHEGYKDAMRQHREEVRRIKAQLTIKTSSISASEIRRLGRISILFLEVGGESDKGSGKG